MGGLGKFTGLHTEMGPSACGFMLLGVPGGGVVRNLTSKTCTYASVYREDRKEHQALLYSSEQWSSSPQHPCIIVYLLASHLNVRVAIFSVLSLCAL